MRAARTTKGNEITTDNKPTDRRGPDTRLIEERVKAIRAEAVDALMSNHAPDVVMFDALNPLR